MNDSGEQLTEWQKNIEKEMKKEESEEKPMISTAAGSSSSIGVNASEPTAAATEVKESGIGQTPSVGGGRSNIPLSTMRNKRQKPNVSENEFLLNKF